jgi:hypothetical protein
VARSNGESSIDIFEISYEESVSYFKRLENLEKIRHTNGPGPDTLPVSHPNCGVYIYIDRNNQNTAY